MHKQVMRNILKRLLQKQGYATDEAPDGATALALMQQRFYDVVSH
jgi:CheY-like chemotaxis protein